MEAGLKRLRVTSIRSAHLIRLVLLFAGILSFILAVIVNSQILTFIGLGLIFWGALFFFVTPQRYVDGSLLGSSTLSSYQTISRIVRDLKVKSRGYYIPPFPRNEYLPDHLKGLKEMVVFVPEETNVEIPSIEEMAEGKFLLKNPKGILIVPPGAGILNRIESQFSVDFNNMDFAALRELLPRFILEKFGLAEELDLSINENLVDMEVAGSVYKDLYSNDLNLESVSIFGCPIISAVACVLAKATGKAVTLNKLQFSPNNQIKAQFTIISRRS